MGLELDVDAIHARSAWTGAARLEEAERRLREAERARVEAIRERDAALRARDVLQQELEERTQERDDHAAARQALAQERKALENEAAVLLKRISELTQLLAETTDTDRQLALALEMNRLQRRVDDRNRALYGSRSERRRRQGEDEEEEEDQSRKRRRRRRKKPRSRGRRPQPKLTRRVQLHLLDEAQLQGGCDKCEGDLKRWKDQHEDSERINAKRIVYELVVSRQQKYRCGDCGHIVTTPKPKSFMPGGRYTEEFAAQVAVDKYDDAIPLTRQVKRMARRGLQVTATTLWDQLVRFYILLAPTLIALHERILEAELVFADETSWRVMRPGETKKWWVWVLSDGESVYFLVAPTRGRAAARQLFEDYAGFLMADDYSVYNALEGERSQQGGRVQVMDEEGNIITLPTPDYILGSCWAHARRYFFKAAAYHDEAEDALDFIDRLYAVEEEAQQQAEACVAAAREAGSSDAEADGRHQAHLEEARRTLRQERSRPIIDELDAWRKRQTPMPGSAMDEALEHLDRIWGKLLRYLDRPVVPMDNNLSERLVRGPVLGRKNYQGSRSESGTRVAALFYSLLSTCRLMGLEPHDYLLEAVRRAVQDPGSVFLPHEYREILRQREAEVETATDQAGPTS